MKLEIIKTADGSQTLHLPEMNEHYHSVNGAVTESNYVYIEKGFLAHPSKSPKVFEVGFGTGLNAMLTALEAEKTKRKTLYIAIEKFPLGENTIAQLNYGRSISPRAAQLFQKIHGCIWGQDVEISSHFSLLKIKGDLLGFDFAQIAGCDVIYFDAFGPNKQPEMWQPGVFTKIYEVTAEQGIFVTYSAKGEVRRQLAAIGFAMERLPGPPGKIHILRGIKRVSNL